MARSFAHPTSLRDLDLHLQQRGTQALAVRVEAERDRDAAAECVAADELQRVELRQVEPRALALDDGREVTLYRLGRYLPFEQRVIIRPIGDQRQDRRVALVAGAR